ncbi:hypothetical protein GC174_12750 [bacterium]|nr:hypothetical protein [bacterium]
MTSADTKCSSIAKSSPDLAEIEKSLYTLWTRKGAREEFLSGGSPEGVNGEFAKSVDCKGIKLYSSLIRTGQNDLMHSIYPGCAGLIGKGFQDVVGKYFEQFPPHHHNFNRAASRFSTYLASSGDRYVKKYPFMPELADYEWVELEIMEHPALTPDNVGDFKELDSPELFDKFGPVVNSALVIRRYEYPIAKIVDWLKDGVRLPRRVKKEATALAIYRSCEDHSARFLELGEVAALVIERAMSDDAVSYADLIKLAVESQAGTEPQQVILDFLTLVERLREMELFVASVEI